MLLIFIDLFRKCAWVVPLKDKKGVSIVNTFQSILDSSKGKPNKIWVDQGSDGFAEYNEKDNKFKVGGHVRISKFKNVFAKGVHIPNCFVYIPNWSEEIFVVKKIKNTVRNL